MAETNAGQEQRDKDSQDLRSDRPAITPPPIASLHDDLADVARQERDANMLYLTIGILAVLLIGVALGIWYVSSSPPTEATVQSFQDDPVERVANDGGEDEPDMPDPVPMPSISWLERPQRAGVEALPQELFTTFHVGMLGDQRILLAERTCQQPCMQAPFYRLLETESGLSYLASASDPLLDQDRERFAMDESTVLPGLQPPGTVALPGTATRLHLTKLQPNKLFDHQGVTPAFDTPEGTVYLASSDQDARIASCPVMRRPDGTVARYRYALNFVRESPAGLFEPGPEPSEPIAWNDGSVNQASYAAAALAGCGEAACYDVVRVDEDALQAAGSTANGVTVYELPADHALMHDFRNRSGSALDAEAFAAEHPLIFWKDPAGRWIRLKRGDLAPVPGCG